MIEKEKDFTKSINGKDLTKLKETEKYELGLQDGLNFTLEKEREVMEKGLAVEGAYAKGLLDGIQKNPEQQAASRLK